MNEVLITEYYTTILLLRIALQLARHLKIKQINTHS